MPRKILSIFLQFHKKQVENRILLIEKPLMRLKKRVECEVGDGCHACRRGK